MTLIPFQNRPPQTLMSSILILMGGEMDGWWINERIEKNDREEKGEQ